MSFIKLWFMASAAFLATLFLYHFAPIVLFLLAVTAMLGVIVFAVVAIARAVERKKSGSEP